MNFLQAHGYESGPTQRPILVGATAGAIAELPSLLILWRAGSLRRLAELATLSPFSIVILHAAAMVAAGILYGRLLQRAANDLRGGWLFGLGYGFLLWMAGPLTILQWITRQPVATGVAAIGLMTSFLIWGLVVGGLFPYVHRPFLRSLAR